MFAAFLGHVMQRAQGRAQASLDDLLHVGATKAQGSAYLDGGQLPSTCLGVNGWQGESKILSSFGGLQPAVTFTLRSGLLR